MKFNYCGVSYDSTENKNLAVRTALQAGSGSASKNNAREWAEIAIECSGNSALESILKMRELPFPDFEAALKIYENPTLKRPLFTLKPQLPPTKSETTQTFFTDEWFEKRKGPRGVERKKNRYRQ